MLSQSAEYALRAALYMARQEDPGPVRVADMARELDIPRNYLSKILHQLVRAGILRSTRGPGGGFELADAPDALALLDITQPVSPEETRVACLLGRPRCSDENPCSAHARWTAVNAHVREFFEGTTLQDLLRPQADGEGGPDP